MFDFVRTLDFLAPSFWLFVAAALALSWAAPRSLRRQVVLAASLVFLVNLLPLPSLLLYALLLLATFGAGRVVAARGSGSTPAFYLSIALLIGLFFVIRHPQAREFLGARLLGTGAFDRDVALLVGYSYFMFRAINFLITVRVGTLRQFGFLDYANFMLFFAAFTAGPIARFVDEADAPFAERSDLDRSVAGVHRILNGLIKKYVFVDIVAQFSLAAFDSPANIASVGIGWLATWTYLLYVYLDLSAYSDIAIGIGLLFGFRLPENFNFPLLRSNLVRFWENWHMSLTSWIRDHVFTPISWRFLQAGGSRGDGVFWGVPHIATMVIFGIWHAPTSAFVVFGLIHGVALASCQKVIAWRRRALGDGANRFLDEHPLARALGVAAVQLFVAVTLILIRYDLTDSVDLMRFLFTGARP